MAEIIGSAGILFTIIVYSTLFYLGTHQKKFFNNNTVIFTGKQLTQIISGVEFYKQVNGAYPDSLQQVVSYAPFIYDAAGGIGFMKKLPLYYYKKSINGGYYLFSVGEDGKPFTKDDILPELTEKEKAKIGLIYNR